LYTYLLINLFSIAIPFGFSFEKKLLFFKKWKFLFPAIIITAIFFLIWDGIFTDLGVWGFNDRSANGRCCPGKRSTPRPWRARIAQG
jgi:lycopene cyclase domain-containing protein